MLNGPHATERVQMRVPGRKLHMVSRRPLSAWMESHFAHNAARCRVCLVDSSVGDVHLPLSIDFQVAV